MNLANHDHSLCARLSRLSLQEHNHDWRPEGRGIHIFKDDIWPNLRDPEIFAKLLLSGFDGSMFDDACNGGGRGGGAGGGGGGGGSTKERSKKPSGQKMISNIMREVSDKQIYPEEWVRREWAFVEEHCWPTTREAWMGLVSGLEARPSSHPAASLLCVPQRILPPPQPAFLVARVPSLGDDGGLDEHPEWVTGRGHQTKRERDYSIKIYASSGDSRVAAIRRDQPSTAPQVTPGTRVLVYQSRVEGSKQSGDWVSGRVVRRLIGARISKKTPAGWWEIKFDYGTVEYLPLKSGEFNVIKHSRGW